tara:strand:- start:1584 stop:1979 length:396 start_codon:yes stop_codon:yes gene_type:complete
MSFSNTTETLVLNFLFTTGTAARPNAWYLALHTANPTDAATTSTEVSSSNTSYARVNIGALTVSGNNATNGSAIDFPTATGSGFGTVTHVGIWSASTGGTMYAHAQLTSTKAIAAGDVFRIPAGELDVNLD